jgi:hypothetical protein
MGVIGRGHVTAVLATGVVVFVALTTGAAAATTIGQSFTPSGGCQTGADTYVQSGVADGNTYTVPAVGVITSWSFQTGDEVPTGLKLKVLRRLEPSKQFETQWEVTGESQAAGPLTAFAANSRATRIPVVPDEVIGISATGGGDCAVGTGESDAYQFWNGDSAVGSVNPGSLPIFGARIPVSAVVEADADRDGFGDESQDRCPTDPATQGPCPDRIAPGTTIGKRPAKKTTKRRATFALASSEPGSHFECQLDGKGSYAACGPSETLTVRLGRHRLAVRAVDAAGNVDPTPATYQWRVVKKKQKHRHPHKRR